MTVANKIIVRVLIGKVRNERKLAETLRGVPLGQGEWVETVLVGLGMRLLRCNGREK
jgi:hypothetical protein